MKQSNVSNLKFSVSILISCYLIVVHEVGGIYVNNLCLLLECVCHADILAISNLHRCTALVELSLAQNEVIIIPCLDFHHASNRYFNYLHQISELTGLETLADLQRLDMSYNKIARLGEQICVDIFAVQ